MAWELAKILGAPGTVPPVMRFLVGTGGVTKGMPVALGSGGNANRVVAKAGGTNTARPFGVAMGTVAAGDYVEVIPLMPQVVMTLHLGNGSAPVAGTKYGLTAGLDLDQANTTQMMVKVIEPTTDRSGYYNCIGYDWAV